MKFFDRVNHDKLMSEVVLDKLDRELERRGHRFVRYAVDRPWKRQSARRGLHNQSIVAT